MTKEMEMNKGISPEHVLGVLTMVESSFGEDTKILPQHEILNRINSHGFRMSEPSLDKVRKSLGFQIVHGIEESRIPTGLLFGFAINPGIYRVKKNEREETMLWLKDASAIELVNEQENVGLFLGRNKNEVAVLIRQHILSHISSDDAMNVRTLAKTLPPLKTINDDHEYSYTLTEDRAQRILYDMERAGKVVRTTMTEANEEGRKVHVAYYKKKIARA